MAGLGHDESRLPELNPEPVSEPPGVIIAPVRRLSADLSVQGLQVASVPGGLLPAEQPEHYLGGRHGRAYRATARTAADSAAGTSPIS